MNTISQRPSSTAYKAPDSIEPLGGAPLKLIKVQVEGVEGNTVTFDVKSHTTIDGLSRHWAQYMELEQPDVAIDLSRIKVYLPENDRLPRDTLVSDLPVKKRLKTEEGTQDVVCLKIERLSPKFSRTFLGFEINHVRYEKPGAVHTINFSIMTLTGAAIRFKAARTALIEEMKSFIQDKEGIPPDQQRLIFRGLELPDNMPIGHYILDSDTEARMHLVLRLRGC